jgi:hypothetical protein
VGSRDYHAEATREPFELSLDSGEVVTVRDPTRIPGMSVFTLVQIRDPQPLLAILLDDAFNTAWVELSTWEWVEVTNLVDAVFAHFGADMARTRNLAADLDRYGDAIERDLALHTHYRLREFFDGTETPNTLANLVDAFDRMTTSYFTEARALDMELFEATKDMPPRKSLGPSLVEETPVVAILKGIHELLQQNVHFAAGASMSKKKPKVTKLPRPKTSKDAWEQEQARQAYLHLEAVLNFVPQEQFEQTIANAPEGAIELR